jgi:glycosyltransferase involved in cell wall biosynthesis
MTEGKPRILSIIPYQVFPAKLGGEKGIAVFNEYLAREVELASITVRSNDPKYAKGYKLYNIISDSRLRYFNIFLFFIVRKMLKRERATHLLIEHPYYGWLAWLLRSSTGVQWLVHSHNIEYMRSKSIGRWWWKALKSYEGWVYRKADNIFFISEDDREHAIQHLGVSRDKTIAVTYGIEQAVIPLDIDECSKKVRELYGIADDCRILLFNGALYHSTNYDALSVILEHINPYLLSHPTFRYKIIVCGKGLPDFFNELKEYADKNVIYAGFVEDISMYFKAADIFLNPILTGAGVKTKAIEALAMNCTVVSTPLGALGINRDVCGDKLKVVAEGEWNTFADIVVTAASGQSQTPADFFDYYYWGNIIARAVKKLD